LQKKELSSTPVDTPSSQAAVEPSTGLPIAPAAPIPTKPGREVAANEGKTRITREATEETSEKARQFQNALAAATGALAVKPQDSPLNTKSEDVAQNQRQALGFDWYLGNKLQGKDAKVPGGTPADTSTLQYQAGAESAKSSVDSDRDRLLSDTVSSFSGGAPATTMNSDRAPVLGDMPFGGRLFTEEPVVQQPNPLVQRSTSVPAAVESAGKPVTGHGATVSGIENAWGAPPTQNARKTAGSSGSTVVLPYSTPQSAGDAYFSIDPESRGVIKVAEADTAKSVDQVLEREKELAPTVIVGGAVSGITTPLQHHAKAVLAPTTDGRTDVYSLNIVGYVDASKWTNALTLVPLQLDTANTKSAFKDRSLREKEDSEVAQKADELQRSRQAEAKRLQTQTNAPQADVAPPKAPAGAPVPQPEIQTCDNALSTFSLNVSDVSFKLAAASLEKGVMPDPSTVRSEEFINAFDYRDPESPPGVPIAFAWDRARYPFAQNRDLLRFSLKTAAQGRQSGRPLNIVLLLDNSGSMERADRVHIIHEALRVLAAQLHAQDKLSVVTFSRTPRLWVDGVSGSQAAQVAEEISGLTPEGGTNLEDAMNLAYQTALRHYLAGGINRVVLLTDGAANLGNVGPDALKNKVEDHRKQGVALDCFGIGWEGYNDDLLEVLSRNGDGRYGFLNTPEEAATEFAGQLAGALHVAASDVKVQVEFNPTRVTAYRQLGYAKHQLTKEQFRDNTVDAAEIGAAESGNALYVIAVNPAGEGPLATVRVRYKVPGTTGYHEHEWPVPYTGSAVALDQAGPAMRLAATASAFSEWLVSSPYATEVTPDRLLACLSGVPEIYGADARPKKLEWMLRQAKSVAGK
jgi:Mg-chelatase subunit ChlD